MKVTKIGKQLTQTLLVIVNALNRSHGCGTKCNAQVYKMGWIDYKLYIEIADCGVGNSALLISVSVHNSQTAAPLAMMIASRTTHAAERWRCLPCMSNSVIKWVPLAG